MTDAIGSRCVCAVRLFVRVAKMDVRQIPKAPGELPSEAVNASLTKLMASANTGRPVDFATYGGRDFQPATKFEGKKAGYVFTRGDRGVGYGTDRSSRIASNEDLVAGITSTDR